MSKKGIVCAIGECPNSSSANPELSYHRFPLDKKLRHASIFKTYQKDKFNPDNSRICSRHFAAKDFHRDLRAELLGTRPMAMLKPGAIPSLFMKVTRKELTNISRSERLKKKQRLEEEIYLVEDPNEIIDNVEEIIDNVGETVQIQQLKKEIQDLKKEFKDVIRTDPSEFALELSTSISQYLNEKMANKVIPNVGLCVALFDLLSVDDSFIFPGDGAAHTKVQFRFVVFRPFIEEVIVGKIKNCSKEGVHITLGFFDDIFVPASNLQHPSRFDEAEQVWIWEYDNNGDKHDLFMDQGEPVKFRVTAETFIESSPAPCPDSEKAVEKTIPEIPYSITATINEPGLGLLSWWEGS